MNVLFVCTGNTCRSPMAEGYVNTKFKNITAKSCGLCADGSPVSRNSKVVMSEIGIDLSAHISNPISLELINWADKIICMSDSHKNALSRIGAEAMVLGNGIFDPYGGNLETYKICRDQIIKEIDNIFPDFSVVPMDYNHIKHIAALEKICFSTPWTEQGILESFKAGTNFFVCLKENKVLGYVGISAILDEGYITNIAVFPEYRKSGVGTALIEYLFKFAKEKKLSFISLEVRESNLTAISLYQKFGFKTEGKRNNFYENPRENALIMTKRFD